MKISFELWWLRSEHAVEAGAILFKDDAGIPLLEAPDFSQYHGVLYGAHAASFPFHRQAKWYVEISDALLTRLSEVYPQFGFCLHPSIPDLRGYSWFNYHAPEFGQAELRLWYTGRVEISRYRDFDEYLSSIRSVRRQEYRRAKDSSLHIEESDSVEELIRLYRLTFERHGISIENLVVERLTSICRAALAHGYGKLLIVRHPKTGTPCSATLTVEDERTRYYLVGANDPEHRGLFGGTLAFLENVRDCFEVGREAYDVVGINSPSRGDFKTSFNAAPQPYFTVTWKRPSQI